MLQALLDSKDFLALTLANPETLGDEFSFALGEHTRVEVWDTGVGIAREHQQAIFQEFFRVSQHQGTEDSLGLGLTIVSRLATLMGYQLALSSVANRGSVFRVMLPAFTQRDQHHEAGPTVVLSSELMPLR